MNRSSDSRSAIASLAPSAERNVRDAWMQRVGVALEVLCGLHPDDLPDCPYADWWGMGYTPEEAAWQALERTLEEDEP